MRHYCRRIASLLTILFVFGQDAMRAQDSVCTVAESGDLTWVVPVLPGTPVVDGELNEWTFARPAVSATTRTIRDDRLGWEAPGPQGDDDLSAVAQLQWDDECLYLAARVTDDELAETTGQKRWGSPWAHDSVVVRFRPPDWLTQGPRAVAKVPDDVHLGLSYYSAGADSRPLPDGCTYIAAKTDTGYVVEASLPFTALGFRPATGDRIPFMLIFSDIDPGKPADLRFDQYGIPTRGFGPRQLAQIRLLCPDGYGADLVAGCKSVRPGSRLDFCGTIDVARREVRLLGLDVVAKSEAGGTWRVDCRRALAPGKRYELSGTLAIPADAGSGDYVLRPAFGP